MKHVRGPLRWAPAVLLATCLSVLAGIVSDAGGSPDRATASNIIVNVEASPTGPLQVNFNPFFPNNQFNIIGATPQIYEPLLQFNVLKPTQITPWLATSYKWSPNSRVLTFQLRKGVTWSDGKPFTSADVAYTFALLARKSALNANGVTFGRVSTPGKYTVKLTFPKPSFTQFYNIAGATYIVPQHIWSTISDPVSYTNPKPVGTGPFVLASATAQAYQLKRNPHYWQAGLPKIGGLRYIAYDANPSANLALEQGQLDWAGNFVPSIQKLYVDKDPKHNFYWMVPRRVAFLCANTQEYPFGMVAVRKAMSMALDRQAMVAAGEENEQPPATTPTGLVLPNHAAYLNPKYKNLRFKQDTEGAKALLQSAGFKMGSNGIFNRPDGKPFSFTILGAAPFTDVMIDLQVVAQQLKKAGIDASVEGAAVGAWLSRLGSGDYDVSFGCGGQPADPGPFTMLNNVLNSSLTAPIGETAVNNQERWKDDKTDALLEQYATATTDAQRQKALNGIQQIMVEKVPAIPLFFNVDFSEYRTVRVTGFPTSKNPYASPAAFGPNAEVVALHLRPVS
jgi:peptide/nickel transport system substrate-binding protein